MKALIQQAQADWFKNRQRFVMELLAMVAVLLFVMVFTWTAGNPDVKTNIFLLGIDVFGCICGLIAAHLRKIINMVLLNVIIIFFSIAGLLKIYFM